ncbi:MAG: Lpg1974 family pore-forming outer membrane protein [Azospirillaceae bacterium]
MHTAGTAGILSFRPFPPAPFRRLPHAVPVPTARDRKRRALPCRHPGQTPTWAQIESLDLIFEGAYRFGEEDAVIFDDPDGRVGTTGTGDGYAGAFALTLGGDGWHGLFRAGHFSTSDADSGSDVTPFPPFGDTTTVETLDHSLRGSTIDLLAGTNVMLGDSTLSLLGGLRYARIEHGLHGMTDNTGGLFDSVIIADDSVTFTGIGPRAEAALTTPLTDGVALVVGAGGTFFRGQAEAIRRFGFSLGGDPFSFGESRYDEHRTVYQLDGLIGVEVDLAPLLGDTGAVLAAGYRIDAWWNTYDLRAFDPLAPETEDRLWQHGPFVRLTVPLL